MRLDYRMLQPAVGIADLATVTVAALSPPDWDLSIMR